MRQLVRNPHFWIILTVIICGAVVYYGDQIPFIDDISSDIPIEFARYSTHRILSIIPVIYAAFVFRFPGGLVAAVFIGLALLPRALLISDEKAEALTEIVAFLSIGLLASWLIDRMEHTITKLEYTKHELVQSLDAVERRQQQLASMYSVSATVYQTLELSQITENILNRVLKATSALAGWIYLMDSETGKLCLSASCGLPMRFASRPEQISLEGSPEGQVAQSGMPLILHSEEECLDSGLLEEDVRTMLFVPLRARTGIEGVLGIATNHVNCHYDQEMEFLVALGNEIGIVIEHARLHQMERTVSQQLRVSEECYRGLFENAIEAIIVCSKMGRIVSANSACKQLTGYQLEELQEFNIWELFSKTSQKNVRQLFSMRLDDVSIEDNDALCLIRKDKREAFVQLKFSTLLRGTDIIGLQAIARDVTEERQLRRNMEYYITQITRAQEDERLRISRELHDDTAQILVGLSRGLDSLLTPKHRLPKTTTAHIAELRQMTESALEGVRRFSQDLRPSILDDLGLVPALEWLLSDTDRHGAVEAMFDITGVPRRLSTEKELITFRVAQEALNNIRKHSDASRVEMIVDFADDALTLIISDNGYGFHMPERTSELVLSDKLGIIGMRERARLIGGTLLVQTEIGRGTTITLRVPV
ncbi:MAG: PAS domain S-box protein [Chloroflexota bacterium]|nr:PAS domain S-box protein [Chloroflexota bacterium]